MSHLFASAFGAFAAGLAVVSAAAGPPRWSAAAPITAASINAAAPQGANDNNPSLIVKAEILLDRAHFSPGAIDGQDGANFRNAVRAFQGVNGFAATGDLDPDTWNALAASGSTALKSYTISGADLAAPFTKAIPADLEAMSRLPGLSYTRPLAELAERFHMSEDLVRRLNPHADFGRARTEIIVADVREMALRPGRHAVEAVLPDIAKDQNDRNTKRVYMWFTRTKSADNYDKIKPRT